MSEQYCKMCQKDISEDNPERKLQCNHSFCTSCVTQLLNSTELCPSCETPLTQASVYQYPMVEPQVENLPTNSEVGPFPVIDPFHETNNSNELPDSPRSTKEGRQLLEEFYKEHQEILTSTETMIANVLSNREKVETMKINKNKLLELISKKSLKLNEVKEAIDEMKPLMNEVSATYLGNSCVERDFHLTLRHFETSRDFLTKIYNEIHNGVKLITCKKIKGDEKFAEISIRDTTIFIHAFAYLIPGVQAKIIEFDDLKDAFLERSLQVFFDFTSPSGLCQRIFMDCYDHSVFTYYFLKLCTGEAGPSYLGCPLQRKSRNNAEEAGYTVSVDSFQTKLDYEDKYQERLCKNSEVFGCLEKKKQYFISFLLSGSFEVFRAETEKMYPNVIGTSDKEATQKLLSEKSFNKVLNCGIALTLNF